MAIVLTGRDGPPRENAAAVDRFLDHVRDQELGLHLRTGHDAAGRPVAAAALAGPGRAAMLLPAPLADATAGAALAPLLVDLLGDLTGVRVAQALLDPDAPEQRSALVAAGFEVLATLVYLVGESPGTGEAATGEPLPGPVGGDLVEVAWSADTRPLFEEAVEGSYEGTLDCPGLVGRRPIGEVLDGHRGAGGPGAFTPARWRVWTDAAGPVAVLLLARLPHEPTLEVVYLGVVARARGRGLGRRLLARAQREALRCGAQRLALAADAANRPALRLYRSAGFRTLQRRVALARFLVPPPA